MRALIAASTLCLAMVAAPAAADRFDYETAGRSTQSTLSKAVSVPEVFESEAQLAESAAALRKVSRDLCRRNHGSSAMQTLIIRTCTANTFKTAVDQLPDTPARLALLAWWETELKDG